MIFVRPTPYQAAVREFSLRSAEHLRKGLARACSVLLAEGVCQTE